MRGKKSRESPLSSPCRTMRPGRQIGVGFLFFRRWNAQLSCCSFFSYSLPSLRSLHCSCSRLVLSRLCVSYVRIPGMKLRARDFTRKHKVLKPLQLIEMGGKTRVEFASWNIPTLPKARRLSRCIILGGGRVLTWASHYSGLSVPAGACLVVMLC